MKKALALVLALVLALSMAVSAFAASDLVVLDKVLPETEEPTEIFVVDMEDEAKILYTRPFMPVWDEELADSYVTYIALNPKANYKDIVLTANGNITAELVKFDPDTMVVDGALELSYAVMSKGENVGKDFFPDDDEKNTYAIEGTYRAPKADKTFGEAYLEAVAEAEKVTGVGKSGYPELTAKGNLITNGLTYDEACLVEDFIETYERSTVYSVVCEQYVNIIKLTVENNFSAHYTEGTLKIEAKLNKKAYAKTLTVINDVSIFEYEEVKYAATHDDALQLGQGGYSDYFTDEYGYGRDYNEDALRFYPCALVVSTTAFRAIAGEDLTLNAFAVEDVMEISVTLKEIAAGQKGVNFFAWSEYTFEDKDEDEVKDFNEDFETLSFGFMGDQIIKGKFEITVDLPMDYYDLREMFGEKVEEDDIISYYVVNQNNEVVKEIKVDYMTYDPEANVEFVIEGENEKLGWYTITMDVPAVESEGEANPNTGAESVVGVVAALAVVSVATAAAVSLKK